MKPVLFLSLLAVSACVSVEQTPTALVRVADEARSPQGIVLSFTALSPCVLVLKHREYRMQYEQTAFRPEIVAVKETGRVALSKGETHKITYLPPGDTPALEVCAVPHKSSQEQCTVIDFSGKDGSLFLTPDSGFVVK
ncbi:MAG: hypothetical protein IKI11_08135 [Neisseriaceae bacterium]|nr:hypothetical protein [Neisseriaceae bacterium]MBR7002610.1 hypothetical protein [Neisseriaceae bacterium]